MPGAMRAWMLIGLLATLAGTALSADQLAITLQQQPWSGDLDGMTQRGYLRVLVPYSRTLYFVDLGGTQRGLSYDFMRAFEDSHNRTLGPGERRLEVVFIPVSRAHLLPMLMSGQGDVVAADLTVTPERQKVVDFTVPAARGVNEIIVTGPGAPPLATLDDLAGREIFVSGARTVEIAVTPGQMFQRVETALRRVAACRRVRP
ncbi:MAG TPA: transporter substrate-binding domain-containing protein [Steroidobacteraceae bacterium]|jgi:ABC-type amino acid transport substrate-binding protein